MHSILGTISLTIRIHLVIPVVEHWLEREIAQWINHEGSIWQPITPWANTLATLASENKNTNSPYVDNTIHIRQEEGRKEGRKEGNVFFNETVNTLYSQLYGIRYMVKDHSDSERGSLLLPHGLLFLISSVFFIYASSHRQDSTYHSLCYIMEH